MTVCSNYKNFFQKILIGLFFSRHVIIYTKQTERFQSAKLYYYFFSQVNTQTVIIVLGGAYEDYGIKWCEYQYDRYSRKRCLR